MRYLHHLLKHLALVLIFLGPEIGAQESLLDRSVVEGPMSGRNYWLYESGPVRPLALSHDGTRLYAANIPDNAVEVFAVNAFGLAHLGTVPVGLEPVALAVTPDDRQVWVVNHLSDSVSVIDVTGNSPEIIETLLVGDEPRDIVFAGPEMSRAFITTAHRGQNTVVDPAFLIPGTARADVWVFDVNNTGGGLGGQPITVISLFGDTPRALAASADGSRVYAAIFRSGNRTTTVPPASLAGTIKAPPNRSADNVPEPSTGLIVKYVNGNWQDELGQVFDGVVGLNLPDLDVFEIDAMAEVPAQTRTYASVGTTLFNMAVNPVNGDIYVSNTDARNHVRFAGLAQRASSTVRGHLADHRISLIRGSQLFHRDLNHHLDYTAQQGTEQDREASLSMPMFMQVSDDGQQLYLAAYGSSKVAVYQTDDLVAGTLPSGPANHIELPGGGPAGLALDEDRQRLYVLTRFNNAVSVVDLGTGAVQNQHDLFNPEPESVKRGRKFLYDARLTSGFGNDSCGTCHLFGDNDSLAWDLGDPDGITRPIPNSYHFLTANSPNLGFTFHPMKGPMTTQSMRGLPRHGPQHWRGDRTGTNPANGETLEEAGFKEFNEAFDALAALGSELSAADMQAFTDFAMQLAYPPNPVRHLDNSLTESQALGESLYNNGVQRSNGNLEICVTCHPITPKSGIFGTTGQMSDNDQPGERDFKIPHFRDQYQKVGMFTFFGFPRPNQVRGFALNHNGATSTNATFSEFGVPATQTNGLKNFLFAFPSESAPVMGQQITVDRLTYPLREARVNLLLQRAGVSEPIPECDLVVSGKIDGRFRAWSFERDSHLFRTDDSSPGMLGESEMLEMLANSDSPFTLTCAPWGSGQRIAIDRDGDGITNHQEVLAGSNPADSGSTAFRPSNGLWVSPAQAGSGFDLHYAGDILVLNWITYLENGDPTWYQAVAPAGQQWSAELLRITWNGDEQQAQEEVVGQVSISFSARNSGRFDWQIGSQQGALDIDRFEFSNQPTEMPLSGIWVDPEDPSFGLTIETQGNVRAVLALFFGEDDQPRWSLSVQENEVSAGSQALSITGPCPWCGDGVVTELGTGAAQFEFSSDDNAISSYQVQLHSLNDESWQRQNIALIKLYGDTNTVPFF